MEYTLDSFVRQLKSMLYESMPFDKGNKYPHANRNFHMRDLALGQNQIIPLGVNGGFYFEIGSDIAEEKAPYYHILEDAQVIRKAGLGTKKSKGSQAFISDTKKRDYGQATYTIINTKRGQKINPYYEYRRNVRGKRSLVKNATQRVIDENGVVTKINRESKYYLNIHYQYIERGLEVITQQIAYMFGMKLKRTQIDYSEEYNDYMADYEKSLSWGSDT